MTAIFVFFSQIPKEDLPSVHFVEMAAMSLISLYVSRLKPNFVTTFQKPFVSEFRKR